MRKKISLHDFIQMNISNLAGVPSIVFGLLGLTIFSSALGLRKKCISCWINNEFINSYQLSLLRHRKQFVQYRMNNEKLLMVWARRNGKRLYMLFYQQQFQEF